MRFQSLTASRAIAALLVVAYHTSGSLCEDPRFWAAKPFHGIFDCGHASVYFFFALSGFMIVAAHRRDVGQPAALKNYAVRRFIRVYPIYWFVVLPVALAYLLFPNAGKPELAAHSVILNSFPLIGRTNHASLAVAWTLFHEVLFYILFGLLICSRRMGSIAMGLWWLACAVAVFAPHLFLDSYMVNPVNLLFAGGAGVFALTRRFTAGPGLPLLLAGCALFLGTGLYETQITKPASELMLYGVASLLILAGLVWIERARPVAVPALLVLLGDASYSIYLCHYTALSIIARIWRRILGHGHADVAFLGLTALAVVPGVLLHLFVEKPMLSALQKRWRSHMHRKAALATEVAVSS